MTLIVRGKDATSGLPRSAQGGEALVDESGAVLGASSTQQYLNGSFNNVSGTVSGDIGYPSFAGDFETYYEMSSSSAAGRIDVGFAGRIGDNQSTLSSIKIPLIGASGAQYQIKVFVEGSGDTNVYSASALTSAPTSRTLISLTDSDLSAQPTGEGRYHIVVEATLDAAETLDVGRPFMKVT